MIHLQTLGTLDLLDLSDGHQIRSVLAQPKRVGFLSYLALASPRGPHQRDTLLAVFWPDSTEKKARNALNQTVFVLRRALGQELFTINGEPRIGVDSGHISCDVWEFEETLESGETEAALDFYRGNFLEGFFLPGCLEFERWVDSERGRLRDLARGAVLSLSQEMETAGNPVGALGWLRRAREWAAYDELVLHRQMELLLALGDRSGAVREFESFARSLSVDLGMEPSKEVQMVLDRPAEPLRAWAGTGSSSDSDVAPIVPPLLSEPLGGRRPPFLGTPMIAGLAAILGLAGGMWASSILLQTAPAAPAPTNQTGVQERVAVLSLENATGDPSLDPLGQTAAEEILHELASKGLANVGSVGQGGDRADGPVSREGLNGRALDLPLTLVNADYLVSGSYFEADGQLVYRARILEVESGSIAVPIDTVLGSLTDHGPAVKRLKERVAGALAMILDPWLSDLAQVATHPPSFEAYQIVADGLELLRRGGTELSGNQRVVMGDSAAAAFARAAASDPQFTLPLVLTLEAVGPDAFSVIEALRARREDLPRWERAMLDYYLAGRSWDHDAQYQAMTRVVDLSSNPTWQYRLAWVAGMTNRPGEEVNLLTELGSDPGWIRNEPFYWTRLLEAKLRLGDFEGVLSDLGRAQAQQAGYAGLFIAEVEALAGLNRVEEATSRAIEILQSSEAQSVSFLSYSLPQALRGRGFHEAARRVAEQGVAQLHGRERVNPFHLASTLVCAGRYDEAREVLGNPEDWPGGRMGVFQLLAYMAAKEGDAEEANRLSSIAPTINDPERRRRDPNGVMSQVEVAAQFGESARAVRLLREAFDGGLAYGTYIYSVWDLTPLYGYKPFEDVMRPKG